MLPYLKYRLKSQGKFRLHSPFVYDFYEEVLERINHENWKVDLRDKLELFLSLKKDVFKENDAYIIEEDIHTDKEKKRKWEEMIKNDEAQLTIDCYHFGIIFKMERKENSSQVKLGLSLTHFTLRGSQ